MELGAGVFMRIFAREIQNNRRLAIAQCAFPETGQRPDRGIAPVCADAKSGIDYVTFTGLHRHTVFADMQASDVILDKMHATRKAGIFEHLFNGTVFDIVAKRLETDLAGVKVSLRRTDQPSGAINDPHDLQRRGSGYQVLPDTASPQQLHGGGQKGRRSAILAGGRRRDVGHAEAESRQRDRCRQPGEPATGNGNIGFMLHVFVASGQFSLVFHSAQCVTACPC